MIFVAIAACDRITGVTARIEAHEPIDAECVPSLGRSLAPADSLRREKMPEAAKVGGYYVVRGSTVTEAVVHIHQDERSPRYVEVSFDWMGPSDEQNENAHIRLLKDVREAIVRSCGLDSGEIKLTAQCSGPVCRQQQVKELLNGQ